MNDWMIVAGVTSIFAVMTIAGMLAWTYFDNLPECFGEDHDDGEREFLDCNECKFKRDCMGEWS